MVADNKLTKVADDKLPKYLTEYISEIDSLMEAVHTDHAKFLKGNMTAGTRIRKYSQKIRECSFGVRYIIQRMKNSNNKNSKKSRTK